jgi:Putative peptidoglycan binding domain
MVRSIESAGRRGRGAQRPWALALLAFLALSPACKGKSIEEREREAAAEMSRSVQDVEAVALAQHVDPAAVKEVQEHLTAIHEYQGAINGKLDSVTVNALEAFQRSQDVKDNGIIDDDIRRRLAHAAGKSPPKAG